MIFSDFLGQSNTQLLIKLGMFSKIDVAREIQAQFQRASESGNEIARMLEVGKHHYNRKHGGY